MTLLFLKCCLLTTIICMVHARNDPLPPYMTPCPQSLPQNEFDECVTQMAREAYPYQVKGDPTRNIPSLDPLKDIKLELQIRNPPLQVKVTDGDMVGLKDLDIVSSRTSLVDGVSEYDINLSRINLVGTYVANGFFIFMPMNDQGPINMTMVNLNLTVRIKFSKKIKKDKVTHMSIREASFRVNSIQRAYYYLGNLFKGAFPPLNDQFNQALDNDWKSVTEEALPSVSQSFGKIFKSVVSRIMQPYPFDNLFPPA